MRQFCVLHREEIITKILPLCRLQNYLFVVNPARNKSTEFAYYNPRLFLYIQAVFRIRSFWVIRIRILSPQTEQFRPKLFIFILNFECREMFNLGEKVAYKFCLLQIKKSYLSKTRIRFFKKCDRIRTTAYRFLDFEVYRAEYLQLSY